MTLRQIHVFVLWFAGALFFSSSAFSATQYQRYYSTWTAARNALFAPYVGQCQSSVDPSNSNFNQTVTYTANGTCASSPSGAQVCEGRGIYGQGGYLYCAVDFFSGTCPTGTADDGTGFCAPVNQCSDKAGQGAGEVWFASGSVDEYGTMNMTTPPGEADYNGCMISLNGQTPTVTGCWETQGGYPRTIYCGVSNYVYTGGLGGSADNIGGGGGGTTPTATTGGDRPATVGSTSVDPVTGGESGPNTATAGTVDLGDRDSSNLASIKKNTDGLDASITGLGGKVDGLGTKLDELGGKVDNVSAKVGQVSNALTTGGDLTATQTNVNGFANGLDSLKQGVEDGVAASMPPSGWGWSPSIPASSCQPWRIPRPGGEVVINPCPAAAMIQSLLGWVIYIMTMLGLFEILFKPKGAA